MIAKEETRWCYGCGETKPLNTKNWAWANKEHTRFRTKCRVCSNYDSMLSHRIARARKKDAKEKQQLGKNNNERSCV